MTSPDSNRNVLFVDDEKEVTKLFELIFKKHFDITTTNDPTEAMEILKQQEFAVIVSDYHMPRMNGMDFLKQVLKQYPDSRRLLVSGDIDRNLIVESLKKAKIHLVVLKPWDNEELKKEIESQIKEYNLQSAFKYEYHTMKDKLENLPEVISRHTDGLLDMLMHLSEVDDIQDFANQFVSAIEGIKSLAYLNTELYMENHDPIIFQHVLDYMSDIEVIANQYEQKILSMFVSIIRAYLYLFQGELTEAQLNYKASSAFYDWYRGSGLDPLMEESINNYPIREVKTQEVTEEVLQAAEVNLRRLFSMETSRIINISESMLSYYSEIKSSIFYFLIMKDELPCYGKSGKDSNLHIGLISGFVVALSSFIQEVIEESGDIDTVSYEKGVILFHQIKNLSFVVFATSNDVRHRIALRQFAIETRERLEKIPKNHMATGADEAFLDQKVEKIFGEF